MSKILFNDELKITCVNPRGILNLMKAVEAAKGEGFILDPQERHTHIPKALSMHEFTVTLVKAESALAEELKGKSPDELVEIIKSDEGKERLIKIASLLDIPIPEDKKVPKAISGHLCKVIKGEVE